MCINERFVFAGGSLASNAPNCQRELERVHIQKSKLTEVEHLIISFGKYKIELSCRTCVFLYEIFYNI